MKDTDKRTLRSVLLTLGLQDDQALLPDSLISAFQAFANNPNASVMELHRAIVETSLAETYQSIRTWLSGLAAEQGLGWDFGPDNQDDAITRERENIARDTEEANRQFKAQLAAIDANLDKAKQILATKNPIQAIHQLDEARKS